MYKGVSLHIGVNRLSTQWYRSEAPLCSPENDAQAMSDLAKKEGYGPISFLLGQNATKENFMQALSEYGQILNTGDTFLLTFSGHGGQVEDDGADEDDGKDETWCFYDSHLKDDELGAKWKDFKEGVRIIVVSSSCHSRTALKPHSGGSKSSWRSKPVKKPALYFYPEDKEIKASIIHLSACDDSQEARDGNYFSRFTELLLKHWNNGSFMGSYQDLAAEINRDAGYLQKSGVAVLGNNCPVLLNSRPFTILTNKT